MNEQKIDREVQALAVAPEGTTSDSGQDGSGDDAHDRDTGPHSTDLVVPGVHTIVNLDDPGQVAQAIVDIRHLESLLREAKAVLTDALDAEATRQGSRTLHLPDGTKVEVRRPTDIAWDAEQLEQALRDAGMPEDRIRQVVVEQVTYEVSAQEAKRAAGANPAYAAAVNAARHDRAQRPTVTITRPR
jgi:hypothetical protein